MLGAPIQPLFVAVHAVAGESLLSVIARSANENVIERVSELLALAEVPLGQELLPFGQKSDLFGLERMMGVAPGSVRSRMHEPHSSNPGWVNWFGTRVPRHFIETRTRRYSATSLGSGAYHRAMWMIRPLAFCSESLEQLTSTCPHCAQSGGTQGWAVAHGIDNCDSCKGSLIDAPMKKIDSSLSHDARAAASLVDTDADIRARAVSELPQPFSGWESGEVFAVMVELGALFKAGFDKEKRRRFVRLAARGNYSEFQCEDLVAGYRFVKHWPDSLAEHLPRVLVENSLSLATLAGPFGKYFVSGTRDTPFRALMRESITKLLDSYDIERNRRSGKAPGWLSPSGFITQTEAVKRFSLEKSTLRLLAKHGSSARPNNGTTRFEAGALETSVKNWRNGARASECGWTLGLPPYCIDRLGARGLIVTVTDQDALLMAGEQLYDRTSIEALKADIQAICTQSGEAGITATAMLRSALHPDAWALLLVTILEGRLRVIQHGHEQPVMDMVIDIDDAERFVCELPSEIFRNHTGTVSCRMADHLLGYTEGIIGAAYRTGLLPGKSLGNCVEIPVMELSIFDRQYVTSREAASSIGLHNSLFARKMIESGSKAVAKVKNSFLWRRVDAQRAFPGKFSFQNGQTTASATSYVPG